MIPLDKECGFNTFTPIDILVFFFAAIIFFAIIVITGMPLKYLFRLPGNVHFLRLGGNL